MHTHIYYKVWIYEYTTLNISQVLMHTEGSLTRCLLIGFVFYKQKAKEIHSKTYREGTVYE
jgi:hypothetical protein